MKSPFPFQREAIDAVYTYWQKKDSGDGLLVVPTGGGKSFIMAKIIQEICTGWPGTRVLILTHVAELIEQDYKETKELWPECPAGIFSAGLGEKDFHAQIIFAGIQSLEKHVHKLSPVPEIVIIDEAHLIPRNENTRYVKTLSTLRLMYPSLRILGLTATPYRLDSGMLTEGDDKMFDDIIYNIEIKYLIDAGYLVPIVSRSGAVHIDTGAVHKRGGEYIPGELSRAAMAGDTTELAVADIIERGESRKSWLIFTTGVDHALQVRDSLKERYIPCEAVLGSTPKAKRSEYVAAHKCGAIKAIVCVDTLTTGYNNPRLDLIACLRPTASPGLWVQMLGRGTRTAPGKTDCLLLDYTDNSTRIGPIDAIKPDAPGSGDGLPPAKECECGMIIPAGCRTCPFCGFRFPEPEKKILARPTVAPLLKSQIESTELDVISATYNVHKKAGKPDSVRIEYSCRTAFIREWIFPEGQTEAGLFYYRRFLREAGHPTVPVSSEALCADPPPLPKKIIVVPDGKYTRVKRRIYGQV